MRIALFPDDYLPSSTLVHAKMFHDLALELKLCGHDPIIITPSHGPQKERLEIEFIDGIEVWRFRNPPMRGVGKLKRALSETLISFNAYLAIKKKIMDKPVDACINYSPTIFFGPLLLWFKKKHCTYNYLILRDMFPQWIIDEGLIKGGSLIAKYFQLFETLNYRSSDKIGLMSDANVKYFSKVQPRYSNTEVLRNWADIKPYSTSELVKGIRCEYQLEDKCIFFYGGNIGHAQDMNNLLRLVESMKCYQQAHFLFVGQGDEVELVKTMKTERGLDNLTFLSSVSQDEFKQLLTQVDVGLFSLAASHKAHNFPGKLLGYMVQSLPILGSVNPGNDLIDLINEKEAGIAFVNGEDDELLKSAVKLLNNETERRRLGSNAYKVLTNHFSVQSVAKQLIRHIALGKN
ncbi:glycosyltransferase WbuB [Shewanella algicola]|uniref:Glycosyltransferase family 4 protein n=1 Tax=Shewanella algicola TaxID=640633 RepID=A0A9X1Z9M1_9GAMM|nr:glycosyltransferase family 4 protein [Shewanella algicola]MCL1106157.1 glycosyltransferase family 4 protein [Shewanella algicola]GGP57802.1 glycosyltransferase WbuB [Shewanella algicola]